MDKYGCDRPDLRFGLEMQDITEIVKEVLAKYPNQTEEYKRLPNNKKGKKRKKGLTGLFVGDVMKASKGRANPKIVTEVIAKLLED